jgi:steroid delta-isomerase-like uncharacterized protein
MYQTNSEFIRRWFEEVWNQGRVEAIDEMFAADGVAHGLSGDKDNPVRGTAGFKAFHESFRGAFPDIKVTVLDIVTEGDKVAALCEVRATHTGGTLGFAATHKPVEITGMTICRIRDGKIAEASNVFDFLTLYRQLGAIGEPGK